MRLKCIACWTRPVRMRCRSCFSKWDLVRTICSRPQTWRRRFQTQIDRCRVARRRSRGSRYNQANQNETSAESRTRPDRKTVGSKVNARRRRRRHWPRCRLFWRRVKSTRLFKWLFISHPITICLRMKMCCQSLLLPHPILMFLLS